MSQLTVLLCFQFISCFSLLHSYEQCIHKKIEHRTGNFNFAAIKSWDTTRWYQMPGWHVGL